MMSEVLAEDATFDITVIELSNKTPAIDQNLCRATGFVRGAAGAALPGATFEFMITGSPRVVGGIAVLATKVVTQSSRVGLVDVELIRNATYDVVAEGMEDKPLRIKTPDAGYVDFTELLFPYPASVTGSVGSVSVSVGDTEPVTLAISLGSLVEVPYEYANGDKVEIDDFLKVESSDTGVATAAIKEGIVSITGWSVGSASVSVLPSDFTENREPETSGLLVIPVLVV